VAEADVADDRVVRIDGRRKTQVGKGVSVAAAAAAVHGGKTQTFVGEVERSGLECGSGDWRVWWWGFAEELTMRGIAEVEATMSGDACE
jgi:hypothetical protein